MQWRHGYITITHTKVKESSLPDDLFIFGWKKSWMQIFPKRYVNAKVSSKIWTQIIEFIFYTDNRYSTKAYHAYVMSLLVKYIPFIYIYIHIYIYIYMKSK